jgi:hypothetical protein
MRYALVDANGNVVNAIESDGTSTWVPPEGLQAIPDPSDKVGPGWTHKHGAFAPPPSVPRPPK